ncbi:MAG: CPBP family intramembrane metalloprotease domain-containing protein [Marinosulfonomonas sp.]|nr:MAG: CPBP family intramembrane metalloprotease domain-containing protein [Marinosulfonomonas sp.]
MFTQKFGQYVDPARAYPQIWRLILGVMLIAAIYIAIAFLVLGAALRLLDPFLLPALNQGTTISSMLLLFASFLGGIVGPMLTVRLLHKRPIMSLLGDRTSALHNFTVSVATVMAIFSGLLIIWSIWFDPLPNLDLSLWLKILPFTLIGLMVQTLAEELVFRGYLQQQLAARFRSPLIWMLLPSFGFAALHYDPSITGENTWLVIGAVGLFGLIAADLTRITGNLGAAWGFHFANNIWAIALLSVQGNLTGVALFVTPYSADDGRLTALIAGDIVAMVIVWVFLRRLFLR